MSLLAIWENSFLLLLGLYLGTMNGMNLRPTLRQPRNWRRLPLLVPFLFLAALLAWRFFPARKTAAEAPAAFHDLTLSEAQEVQVEIVSGDCCAVALERGGMEAREAARLVADVRPAYDLARIRSGQVLTFFFENGRLRNLVYPIDRDRFLEAMRAGTGGFRGRVAAVPYEVRRETVRLRIASSLYEATLASGEMMELFEPLSRMFEYDVDFNRDIQPGDTVAAVLEKKYLDGRLAAYGDILAAELVNGGKAIQVVRYPAPGGGSGYYHPDGRSTKRMFLRSPLPFVRVTSRYGMRRHPVLGYSRQHNGTDFAAPYGTPVRATAAGIVIARGRDNGRGNYVSIRHANGYGSHYYHLQRFAIGLRHGQRVEQGQVIGIVGSTGLSTGPHLHYGLVHNSRFVNPLRLQSPSTAPLPRERLAGFQEYCAQVLAPISGPVPGKARSLPALERGKLPIAPRRFLNPR
jgi:murein DD-endopeptidase MepM/ murein hydrolase activator NlpD